MTQYPKMIRQFLLLPEIKEMIIIHILMFVFKNMLILGINLLVVKKDNKNVDVFLNGACLQLLSFNIQILIVLLSCILNFEITMYNSKTFLGTLNVYGGIDYLNAFLTLFKENISFLVVILPLLLGLIVFIECIITARNQKVLDSLYREKFLAISANYDILRAYFIRKNLLSITTILFITKFSLLLNFLYIYFKTNDSKSELILFKGNFNIAYRKHPFLIPTSMILVFIVIIFNTFLINKEYLFQRAISIIFSIIMIFIETIMLFISYFSESRLFGKS